MIRIEASKELFNKFQEVSDKLLELRAFCQNTVVVPDEDFQKFGEEYRRWVDEDYRALTLAVADFAKTHIIRLPDVGTMSDEIQPN